MTEIKQVLVVEDEPLIGLQLKAALEDVGYSVVGPVASLEDAWDAGTAEDFDAAVLDVNLNGTSVFPFAEHLVRRGVPTVLLTGYDLPELPPGAAHIPVLRKPLDVHVLDIILRRIGRQAPRPSEPARAGV
ncbi:response regulator [Novispirillum sp. DQ9]|uniref:response regulator n=1 Tax=Novispirillum sp. DQ9 TaxID=3398612 RepID=UPI003C7DD834